MSDSSIPFVPHDKITKELLQRIEAIEVSLSAANLTEAEKFVFENTGMNPGMQRRYKAELKKVLGLPPRTAASVILAHAQFRQALEYIMVREERSDRLTLRSAKGLGVVMPSGELLSIEDFLKTLYPREGVNAASCYRALLGRCRKKQILRDDGRPCPLEELPSESSVKVFLRNWRNEYIAVRRGRSRKHDWEVMQQPYVTRDVTQYSPGELWIGDHTELDFIVLNEHGKPDRRWITAFIDIRTSLLVGYFLSWKPCSQTIALAYRNAVVGTQLRAFTGETFEKVSVVNVPSTILIDNGKDYRSNYTQRIFGKIDFDDAARLSIQRLTKLQYAIPYHGQSKAQMERWFGTIQTMLKYLPGFKGNKYQNKPDSLADDMKKGTILNVEQFDALVALAINSYNNRVHRKLKGQSPLEYYLTNQATQRSIDLRVLDFLLMKTQERRIRRCQVTIFGKEYYSDSLMKFNDRAADVYYDPNDLGFVSIYVGGKFAAVASNKEMIGRDERGYLQILQDRKRSEREMQAQLKEHHKGVTNADARLLLLEGELLNMNMISKELIRKNAPSITHITGIEQQAKEHQEELDSQKQVVEIEHEAKKHAKKHPLTLSMVNNIK